jgi:hypothetical protein
MLRILSVAAVAVVALSGPAFAREVVKNKNALIVRGMSPNNCSAQSLADGSDPQVKKNEDVQNLSVICSPDGSLTVQQLRQGLPNAHVCWVRLRDLEKVSRSTVKVVTDPLLIPQPNPLHCLVSDITPNQLRKVMKYQP